MEILESGNNSYLSHKVAEKDGHKGFWLGETPCKFSAIQVDFDTLKTGWGFYDGIDDKPLLWNRFTFGEFESLKIMLKQGWNEWQKDKSKLPTYKYTGSEDIKVGMGSTSIAQFEFIGCRPRKE